MKMGFSFPKGSPDEVHMAVSDEVAEVQKHCSLIAALGNKSMLEKHWMQVWGLADPAPATLNLHNFTLKDLLDHGIDEHLEKVEEISAFAGGEAAIMRTIDDISALWAETSYVVKQYRDTKDRYFITEIDDLVT